MLKYSQLLLFVSTAVTMPSSELDLVAISAFPSAAPGLLPLQLCSYASQLLCSGESCGEMQVEGWGFQASVFKWKRKTLPNVVFNSRSIIKNIFGTLKITSILTPYVEDSIFQKYLVFRMKSAKVRIKSVHSQNFPEVVATFFLQGRDLAVPSRWRDGPSLFFIFYFIQQRDLGSLNMVAWFFCCVKSAGREADREEVSSPAPSAQMMSAK